MSGPRRRTAMAVLAGFLLAALPASAQEGGAFDDARLEAFVTAAIAVEDMADDWQARIAAAATPEEEAALNEAAAAALSEKIEASPGIDVDQYMEILGASRGDATLRRKIAELYARRKGG